MGAKYDITITLLSPAGMAGGDLHSASAERPSDVPLSQVCMAGHCTPYSGCCPSCNSSPEARPQHCAPAWAPMGTNFPTACTCAPHPHLQQLYLNSDLSLYFCFAVGVPLPNSEGFSRLDFGPGSIALLQGCMHTCCVTGLVLCRLCQS